MKVIFKHRLLAILSLVATFACVSVSYAKDFLVLETSKGNVEIELLADVAPKHVEQITKLAKEGFYDGIVFHRVIEGFMAQTGDPTGTGAGGSKLPDVPAEFSNVPFDRGVVGAARTQDPNSANSQFFIMFDQGHFLNNQYTVFGRVVSGMDNIDKIQRGEGQGGIVPTDKRDKIIKATVATR